MRSTSMKIALCVLLLVIWGFVITWKVTVWNECRFENSRMYCLSLVSK